MPEQHPIEGVPLFGRCPECGKPVRGTASGKPASPEWRMMRRPSCGTSVRGAVLYEALVVEALLVLADAGRQRQLFLSAAGEVWSLVECGETLCDDSGLSDILDKGRAVYGREIDAQLDEISKRAQVLLDVEDDQGIEAMLTHPVMVGTRRLAAAVADGVNAALGGSAP